MDKLPYRVFETLSTEWKDRDTVPESSDDPGYDIFFDVTSELRGIFGEMDLFGDAKSLTHNQRRAGALVLFATAIPWDGLLIGVFVNQPEIIPHAHEAARSLGLTKAIPFTKRLAEMMLPEIARKDLDDRLEWAESHDSLSTELEEIEESDPFEDARMEMLHAALRLAVEHPDEFFDSK